MSTISPGNGSEDYGGGSNNGFKRSDNSSVSMGHKKEFIDGDAQWTMNMYTNLRAYSPKCRSHHFSFKTKDHKRK